MTARARGPAWEQMQRDVREFMGVTDEASDNLLCRYGYAAGRADAEDEGLAARRSATRRTLVYAYHLQSERAAAWGLVWGPKARRYKALHLRAMTRIACLIRGEPAFGKAAP